MSKTVDQRVVEMQFDNKHFETNVKTTMSTLDKLKQSLNLNGAAKGLDQVNAAAKKCDFNPLSQGVQTVQAKFSALQIAGITALTNITNSAINAGKNIVSALTIQPVTTGFNEYELKMGSLRTIMAGTGEDLETVNKYLNELNEYSDKTIYSFSDMTQNIGKFTNAGVKLEDAVAAIKGVSNVAAVSGANTNEASRAMYNFAQALSSGYVKLIDWKSIELANMGTVEFKQQLIDAAVAAGTLTKAADGMYQTVEGKLVSATTGFNDSLQDQWMTTEVLIGTLKDYADETTEIGKKATEAATKVRTATQLFDTLKEAAQSGWAQTWETIVGDYNEATELFTYLSEKIGSVIESTSKSRNTMLENVLNSPLQNAQRDWNEYIKQINDAGVATEDFQKSLLEIAKSHDSSIGEMIDSGKSFGEILLSGKISSDMITESLKKLAQTASDSSESTDEQVEALQNLASESEKAGTPIEKLIAAMNTPGQTAKRNWEEYLKQINDAGIATEDFQKALLETAKTHDKSIGDMIKDGKSFEEIMKSGKLTSDMIGETLLKFADGANKVSTSTENMNDKLKEMKGLVDKVIRGDFGNGADRMKKLAEAGYEYAEVQELVNKVMAGGKIELDDLSDAQLKSAGYTEEQIKKLRELADQAKKTGTPIEELAKSMDEMSGREKLFASFKNIMEQFGKVLDVIKEAWNEVFGDIDAAGILSDIIDKIYELVGTSEITTESLENLKSAFKGFFDAIWLVGTLGGGVLKTLNTTLGYAAKALGFADKFALIGWIGELITGFKNWITTNNVIVETAKAVGNAIKTYVENIVGNIREVVDSFLALEEVQSILESFRTAFTDSLANIGGWLERTFTLIKTFFGNLPRIFEDGFSFEKVKNALSAFFELLGFIFGDFIDSFTPLGNVIKNFVRALQDYFDMAGSTAENAVATVLGVFEKIKNKISEYYNTIKGWLSENISFGEVFAVLIGVGMIWSILKVAKVLNKAFVTMAKLTGSVKGVFDSLKDMFKGFKEAKMIEAKSVALRNIAISIAILAGSLWVLGQLEWEQIGKGIVAMLGIVIALGGLAFALGKIGKLELDFTAGSHAILALAGAVILIAGALKIMDSLNGDTIWRNVAIIGIIAVGLATIVGVLSKAAPQLSVGSFAMISFAISIGILVHTLNSIGDLKVDNVQDSLGLLVGVMIAMVIASKACSKVSAGSMFGVIGIAAAFFIFVKTLESISSVDAAGIMANIKPLIVIVGLFSVLMIASHLAGKHALKAGIGIVAMSAAMLILLQVIKMMADIDGADIGNATLAIMGIMSIFALIVAASHLAGQHAVKAGAMLMLMSGAMLILTAAMVVMSKMDPKGLDNAVTAIQRIIVFMSLLIAATKVVPEKIEKTVTTLMVSVGLLAVAIAALSLVDPSRLQNATTCLSIVIGALAVAFAAIGFMKVDGKTIATIIIMTTTIGLLAVAIGMLSDIPFENAMGAAGSLSLLMISFSAALVIAGKAGKIAKDAFLGITVMVGVIAILAVIIGILGSLELGSTLEAAASISLLVLALSAACVILKPVGAGGTLAIKGAGVLAAVIGILTAVFAAVGGLVALLGSVVTDEAIANLDKGIEFLKKIAYGLGEIVGSVIGGLAAGVMSGLEDIGTSLSNFMTNLQPFIDGTKNITEESMAGVKTLAETILILTAAELIDRLTSFGSNGESLSTFAEQLVPFGEAMVSFSNTVAGNINEEAVMAAANAGKILAEMAAILPNTGGVAGFFAGENDMDEFGRQLVTFGRCIVAFSTTVSGNINEEAVTAAANAGKVLGEMATALPNTGGVAAFFAGDNDMVTFGQQLISFGRAIVGFSTIVAGNVNEEAVTAAANAGKVLGEMATSLPNTGGVVSWFTGDNDLTMFGQQLISFGHAIVGFSQIVAGNVNEEAITAAANAGKVMVELSNTIPNSGGLVSFFTGDNDLAKFGTQLVVFGNSIASFSAAVAGKVDAAAVENAATAGKALVKLAESLPEDKLFTNETHLDEFGKQLKKFGEGLAGFYSAIGDLKIGNASTAISHAKSIAKFVREIADLDTGGVKKFKDAINDLAKTNMQDFVDAFNVSLPDLSNVGSKMIDSIVTGFTAKTSTLINSASTVMSSVIASMNSKLSMFVTTGSSLMNGFASGFAAKASQVRVALISAISGAIGAISVYYSSFYTSGTYLGSGFVLGVAAKQQAAYNAGYNLGKAAAQGVKDGEDSNSPSKEGIKAGKYLGDGLVIGINSMSKSVYSAGYNMGDTAVKSLSSSISKITDAINSDIDTQPTIRPVLDLSDIESGAGLISGMLTPSGVIANVGGINSAMNRRLQNGVNSDVVSAIDKLRKDVGHLENRSYSVGNINYNDDSVVANALETLIRATRVEGRA